MRKQTQGIASSFDSLAEVALSPDGQFIAFVGRWVENQEKQECRALFLLQLDEQGHPLGDPRNLTSEVAYVSVPVWSPDGHYLLFLANRDGEKPQLCLTDLAGKERQRLTTMMHGVNEVVWSPDGRWLAFTALTPSLQVPPSKHPDTISHEQLFAHLFVMPAPGVFVEKSEDWPKRLTDGVIDYTHLSWTPDSQEIGVLCNAAEEGERSFLSDLWTLSPETGEAHCLTDHTLEIDCYAWSPDGRSVIVVAGRAEPAGHLLQLYLVTRRGNVGDNLLLLAPEIENVALSQTLSTLNTPGPYRPVWSQNGQKIYFLVTEQQEVNVYSLEVVWRTLTRLTNQSLTCFLALCPDGQALLMAQQYFSQTWNLYRLPLHNQHGIEQLTNFS